MCGSGPQGPYGHRFAFLAQEHCHKYRLLSQYHVTHYAHALNTTMTITQDAVLMHLHQDLTGMGINPDIGLGDTGFVQAFYTGPIALTPLQEEDDPHFPK